MWCNIISRPARWKTSWLTLIHDTWLFFFLTRPLMLSAHVFPHGDVSLLKLEPELNGQVKTASLRQRYDPPFKSAAAQAESSREAWRRAIITEWGRNANQPAMRWVWVGRDAHAYHTGLWKTTPPEAPTACFYCACCSRQGLLLFKQL